MEFFNWLVMILVIVVISYGIIFYLNRQQAKRIKEVDKKKQQVMALPVTDKLFTLQNMNLTGQTKQAYESWQATWQTITRFQFPEIEAALVNAEQYLQRMNFVKARKSIDHAEEQLDETQGSVENVDKALDKLLERAPENRRQLEEVQARYNSIRQKLMKHSFNFGPANETLEKNLSYMELDFTKFNALTSDGDHLEAKEVLDRISQDLAIQEEVVEEIPRLNSEIKEEYEEQIADLKEGYARLLEEHYVFRNVDIPAKIRSAEAILEEARASVALADIHAARKKLVQADEAIEAIYVVMEQEMEAKEFVDHNMANIQRKMDHVMQSNRYVIVEIDRVSQNYFLNENEMARALDFEEKLMKENDTIRFYESALKEHEAPYSEVKSYFEKVSVRLTEIDKEQSELVAKLANLRHREKEAKEQIDLFELDLRNMKRTVEKHHLPGLPKAYLDLFFSVSDRIGELAAKLHRVKIDMDEIDKLLKMCEEDIELLDRQTQSIIDNASLTEYLMQYANRHRHSHVEVENAVNRAFVLFNDSFQYEEAVKVLKAALNKVDPDASKRIEDAYLDEKKSHQV